MLCGVGGRTVEEAKARITHAEFRDWITYRNMRGSFFIGNRLESHLGMLTYIVQKAVGGKSSLRDFMPHADDPNQPVELPTVGDQIAAVMANLNAAKVAK